jgi:hypothetical protein
MDNQTTAATEVKVPDIGDFNPDSEVELQDRWISCGIFY